MSERQSYVIGIAGGSGSGKTSVAIELHNRLPNSLILNLDDFQKIGSKPEKLHGFANWDHPSYVDWELFLQDLTKLKNGEDITITNRDQTDLTTSKEKVLTPQDIIIVEGYLLFHNLAVRLLLNKLIFLDCSDVVRMNRRTKFKAPDYVNHVLLPMHKEFVEPTKEHANLIIDTEKYSIAEVVELIQNTLPISLRD